MNWLTDRQEHVLEEDIGITVWQGPPRWALIGETIAMWIYAAAITAAAIIMAGGIALMVTEALFGWPRFMLH